MNYMIILAAIAVFGLLFLILNGIASDNTSNYKKRALINLIFGLINLVGFIIIYFVDKQYEQKYSFFDYMSFVGAITLYTLILFITLYKKGYNNRQKMFGRIKLTTDKKEYLYLVCRCENDIYLEKEKHSGFVIKLDKKDFHDEKIINFVRKYSLIINDDNFIKIGEYILKPKKGKDIFYHCYLVTLPKSLESSEYVAYNKKDIVNLDFDSLDRQIIFRVLLQENFKIEKEI